MLKGKILSIKNTDKGFIVKIDQVKRLFENFEEVENWIIKVALKGKDQKKRDLLKRDCRNFLKIPSENS